MKSNENTSGSSGILYLATLVLQFDNHFNFHRNIIGQ